jgi:hypothetical protein
MMDWVSHEGSVQGMVARVVRTVRTVGECIARHRQGKPAGLQAVFPFSCMSIHFGFWQRLIGRLRLILHHNLNETIWIL